MISTPLSKALARLKEGWERYQIDMSDEQIRDGLIQRFEFSYELSHKLIKRYLEEISANADEIDTMSFSELIRTANEKGLLLNDWERWRVYRQMRNLTSHTYNEDTAILVVASIPDFIKECEYLLGKLNVQDIQQSNE